MSLMKGLMAMTTKAFRYGDALLADITALRHEGKTFDQIAKRLSTKYKVDLSTDGVRKQFAKYGNLAEMSDNETEILRLRDVARTRRASSRTARENRQILEYLDGVDEVVARMRDLTKLVRPVNIRKVKLPEVKHGKAATKMPLLSDLHIGKVSTVYNYNLDVATNRIVQYVDAIIKDIVVTGQQFSVERLVVAVLGDLINSASMHGKESAREAEFGNAQQVYEAARLIFFEVIVRLAQLDLPIDFYCVTGNHDRTDEKRTFIDPGTENWTYVIYKYLEDMAKASGLTNVKFVIPTKSYTTVQIYGNNILLDHGHNAAGGGVTRKSAMAWMGSRQAQLGMLLHGACYGHSHYPQMMGRGEITINGSLCGDDSFADELGLTSFLGGPVQVINTYLETTSRPSCFYTNFPVFLK